MPESEISINYSATAVAKLLKESLQDAQLSLEEIAIVWKKKNKKLTIPCLKQSHIPTANSTNGKDFYIRLYEVYPIGLKKRSGNICITIFALIPLHYNATCLRTRLQSSRLAPHFAVYCSSCVALLCIVFGVCSCCAYTTCMCRQGSLTSVTGMEPSS